MPDSLEKKKTRNQVVPIFVCFLVLSRHPGLTVYIFNDHNGKMCIYFQDVYILSSRSVYIFNDHNGKMPHSATVAFISSSSSSCLYDAKKTAAPGDFTLDN